MIAAMGATGHTGGAIAELLLEAGEEVRALGRSQSRLAALERAAADTRAGDATHPRYLVDAFRGADAVYALLPYDPYAADYSAEQDRLGEAIVHAIADAAVPRVVFLSSIGADRAEGTGFVASLHVQEQRLRGLAGPHVLILRPGSFFENFAAALELIRHEGINADAVAPDVPMPMIATRDIATVAAAALTARDWQGCAVRELHGQRDISYAEATGLLGERLGIPDLPYVQLPPAEMVAALTRMGFSRDFALLHVELAGALSAGTVAATEQRSAANTTPTRFEEFAAELAAVLQAA